MPARVDGGLVLLDPVLRGPLDGVLLLEVADLDGQLVDLGVERLEGLVVLGRPVELAGLRVLLVHQRGELLGPLQERAARVDQCVSHGGSGSRQSPS
jgi:hypothetical protein